jgi:hypothetical protein
MRIAGSLTQKQIACFLVMCLASPFANAATPFWQQAVSPPSQQSAVPSTDAAQPEAALPDAPDAAQSQSNNPGGQTGGSQPSPDQQQNGAAKPVGTAAAPYPAASGVAASRPAGAAIAPAKQRRVRTILISVGVVAAACVALGTVAALSHSSPSQPR